MREILFRGKRKDNGRWAESTYPFGTMAGGVVVHDFDPTTIGQYTGLTDKSGAKIFEGDICRSSLGLLFTVEWDKENARFLGFTTEHECRLVYVGREPKVEIVGNIHDNPGLLKEAGEDKT